MQTVSQYTRTPTHSYGDVITERTFNGFYNKIASARKHNHFECRFLVDVDDLPVASVVSWIEQTFDRVKVSTVTIPHALKHYRDYGHTETWCVVTFV